MPRTVRSAICNVFAPLCRPANGGNYVNECNVHFEYYWKHK